MIKYIFLLILSASILTACDSDKEPAAAPLATISLRIDPGGDFIKGVRKQKGATGSEAVPRLEDGDETGTANENYIDPESLTISIYSEDGRKLGNSGMLSVTRSEEEGKVFYDYLGMMPEAALGETGNGKKLKIMVFANHDDIKPGNGTFSIGNESFTIPMWGVKTITAVNSSGTRNIDAGLITMLRSVAKVGIYVSPEISENFQINSISVRNANLTGNILPGRWSSVSSTLDLDYKSGVINPCVTEGYKSFIMTQINDYEFFVAEEQYSAKNETLSITVSYTHNGKEKSGEILLVNYKNGKPTDLKLDAVRNHFFKFTITGAKEDEIEIDFKFHTWIKDWIDGDQGVLEED